MKILNSLDTNKVDFIEAQTQMMLYLGKFIHIINNIFIGVIIYVLKCVNNKK